MVLTGNYWRGGYFHQKEAADAGIADIYTHSSEHCTRQQKRLSTHDKQGGNVHYFWYSLTSDT